MARFITFKKELVSEAPGAIVFIGNQKMEKIRFRIISYSEQTLSEYEDTSFNSLIKNFQPNTINWINIDGLHDPNVIREVGEYFKLSPLVLDDIVNTDQRPKVFEDENCIVFYLKQLSYDELDKTIKSEHVTLILGNNYVLSFQEKVGTFLNPIRERIRQNQGKIKLSGPDYLCYRIMDTIADHYLLSVGIIGEKVEEVEEDILLKTDKETMEKIYRHKTEISFLRKAIRPVKEITKMLKNSESELLNDKTWGYFHDLDDLITQALETIEVYYSMITDQINIYNTNLNNRANEVMKVLTIFASIFIPLTFVAGVYGTNFDVLPELHFKHGYYMMLGIMVLMTLFMLLYFKRKKWF